MTVRRIVGLSAIASFILMIVAWVVFATMIAGEVKADRTGRMGVVTLMSSADHPIGGAVPANVHVAATMRNAEALTLATYEAYEGSSLLTAVIQRPPTEAEAADLDAWVRDGGRVLVLAGQQSGFPAGGEAPRGSLADLWGLRLAPRPDGVEALPGGVQLSLRSAGRWTSTGRCRITLGGLLADCRLGEGRVLLVADANIAGPLIPSPYLADGGASVISRLLVALEKDAPPPTRFSVDVFGPATQHGFIWPAMAGGLLFWVTLGLAVAWVLMRVADRKPVQRSTTQARVVRNNPDP